MTTLAPKLKPLDQRILDELDGHAMRAGAVAAVLFGKPHWECERCGHVERETYWGGHPRAWLQRKGRDICSKCHPRLRYLVDDPALMHPLLIASPEDTQTVREVLRGLEAVGLARCAGGWWRRV